MKSKLNFFVFDEHTDYVRECMRIGMQPIAKFGDRVIKFSYKGNEYIVLRTSDCYSGWEHTIMRLPQMNFDQLYELALNTKSYEERVGALGILLKHHKVQFTNLLKNLKESRISKNKQITRISKLILSQISERSDYVSEMNDLLEICKSICSKL